MTLLSPAYVSCGYQPYIDSYFIEMLIVVLVSLAFGDSLKLVLILTPETKLCSKSCFFGCPQRRQIQECEWTWQVRGGQDCLRSDTFGLMPQIDEIICVDSM